MVIQKQRGYSLLELVIVIAVLGLIAAIAVPEPASSVQADLRKVSGQFANAIRFARSESIRTGEPHGFRFLTNQYRIRVYSVNSTGSPWTWEFDVYDPVTRQLYDYTFPESLQGTEIPVEHFPDYRGTCDRQGAIYFDAQGTPRCLEPETVLLTQYELVFLIGASEARVVLDGITGRVRIQ